MEIIKERPVNMRVNEALEEMYLRRSSQVKYIQYIHKFTLFLSLSHATGYRALANDHEQKTRCRTRSNEISVGRVRSSHRHH